MGESGIGCTLGPHVFDRWCVPWCCLSLGLWVCAIFAGGGATVSVLTCLVAVLLVCRVGGTMGLVQFGTSKQSLRCRPKMPNVFHQSALSSGGQRSSGLYPFGGRGPPCRGSNRQGLFSFRTWVFMAFLSFGFRIGEARVPGPCASSLTSTDLINFGPWGSAIHQAFPTNHICLHKAQSICGVFQRHTCPSKVKEHS